MTGLQLVQADLLGTWSWSEHDSVCFSRQYLCLQSHSFNLQCFWMSQLLWLASSLANLPQVSRGHWAQSSSCVSWHYSWLFRAPIAKVKSEWGRDTYCWFQSLPFGQVGAGDFFAFLFLQLLPLNILKSSCCRGLTFASIVSIVALCCLIKLRTWLRCHSFVQLRNSSHIVGRKLRGVVDNLLRIPSVLRHSNTLISNRVLFHPWFSSLTLARILVFFACEAEV